MNISPTGAWLCETKEPHGFDEPLAAAIVRQLNKWACYSVSDFGCGSGAYVDYISGAGIICEGCDGNPNTEKFSPRCHVQELSVPFFRIPSSAVLSLEVGEHIPHQFEGVFLDNVAIHAMKNVILSWFPYPGEGIGHINEHPNDYIKNKMKLRGFESLDDVEEELRAAATLWWFKVSIMAFRRL